jgi:prepilin-type N-terminal cleavage/methylation domain-containing protein
MRRAFTIIEIIVVITILGIAAGITIPRLVGGASRTVRATGDEAASVLSALARRDAMLSQPIALDYSQDTGLLRVLTLKQLDRGREWATDRLLPSADLSNVKLISLRSDQQTYVAEDFRIELDQFQPRANIELVLSDTTERWFVTVSLSATSLQAAVRDGKPADNAGEGDLPEAVDLDATGKEEQAW